MEYGLKIADLKSWPWTRGASLEASIGYCIAVFKGGHMEYGIPRRRVRAEEGLAVLEPGLAEERVRSSLSFDTR